MSAYETETHLTENTMQNLPHRYSARAHGGPTGDAVVYHNGLETLVTGAPPQFDGPEGYWSPETLLVAALADCFLLTFRALATRARLAFLQLSVTANGTLDKTRAGLGFTGFDIDARLRLSDPQRKDEAERLLHEAEKRCLIGQSLTGETRLSARVDLEAAPGTRATEYTGSPS